VDSYRPDPANPANGEIVSRKAVDLDEIDESTFRQYLKEFKDKYEPGTTIRSNKYPDLDGKPIQGRQIIEVPLTNKGTPQATAFEKIAQAQGVEIRYRQE
jgi:hypothetical protein